MVQSRTTERIGGKAIKVGRGPIAALVLAAAVAGTVFGTNLVNEEKYAGVVAQDRAAVVRTAESATETGSTTNTVFLGSPFDSDASTRGYSTASGIVVSSVIEVVANPTGASFDCYLNRADQGTGAGLQLVQNLSTTGATVVYQSGHLIGPDHGIGCNTTDRINSNTSLKAGGLFLQSLITE